jgi:hypothetical protein
MAYELILKQRFINKLQRTLLYLEDKWGKPVANILLQKLRCKTSHISNTAIYRHFLK